MQVTVKTQFHYMKQWIRINTKTKKYKVQTKQGGMWWHITEGEELEKPGSKQGEFMTLAITVSHFASSLTIQALNNWPLLVCYRLCDVASSTQPLVTWFSVFFFLSMRLVFFSFLLPALHATVYPWT